MRVIILFKIFKIWCRFKIYSKKKKKNSVWDSFSWIECCKVFLVGRDYMTSAHKVLTNTPRFSDTLRRIFSYSIFAKVMKNYDGSTVVQVFRLFNMLTVASCSETRPFKHLTNDIFRNPSFKEYITDEMSVIFFFSNYSTFDADFRYWPKNWEYFFCFLYNCTLTECDKFFLLRREYLSSAVSVMRNHSRISDTVRPTFSNSTFAKGMKKYNESAAV